MRVMHHDPIGRDVCGLDDLQLEAGLHHAVLAALAESDRLAVADINHTFLGTVLAQRVERAVIEDRAVLKDLDQSRAAMRSRGPQHLREALAVGIQRPSDKCRLRTQCHRHRVERVVQRAHRSRLGDLADLRGR